MNVYILNEDLLVVGCDVIDVRKYLAKEKKDDAYLDPSSVEFRKLKKVEVSEIMILSDDYFDAKPLTMTLDKKIGIDIEVYEDHEWDYKIK